MRSNYCTGTCPLQWWPVLKYASFLLYFLACVAFGQIYACEFWGNVAELDIAQVFGCKPLGLVQNLNPAFVHPPEISRRWQVAVAQGQSNKVEVFVSQHVNAAGSRQPDLDLWLRQLRSAAAQQTQFGLHQAQQLRQQQQQHQRQQQ